MLTMQPALKRAVSLLQIATPSRGTIEAYGNLQSELAKLVSDVNGRHGEVDWTPIRYLNKGFSQTTLAGFYRSAHVGVVTPLYDGMNLVAKEYVAAQNPADPGVLVLSKFAGAAKELDTALQVNPHDIDGMARTLATALAMPAPERRARWEAMMEKLRAGNIQHWFASFVEELEKAHGLATVQPLDAGLVEPIHRWASGRSLESVLRGGELAAGDFVRWCKQVIDVLDQVAQAAPRPGVRAAATTAVDAVRRGVVAYSSV